ncbi:stage II sporulation protein P [Bacillus suaedaesalsae]|uniref:Stage II sporulation protein P n=1 Tax=Bacillus suaedaesalsae TaxID=2810349 RepID=A0ABS2DG11_9BACI|nr:stage II sporulation protein P [Bacillus suaedaesalsae]MBM6617420.1 stage II sporulation protein P [Bacillus suaedaesalsae]
MYIQPKSHTASKYIWFFIVPLLFLLIAPVFIINNTFFTINKVGNHIPIISSEQLIEIISSENQHFSSVIPVKEEVSVLKVGAEFVSNIRFGDIRSLLGTEIPGMQSYHAEILVAGVGTNFTNIPIESTPPMEVLLQEREMAEEQLKELLADKDDTQTPTGTLSEDTFFIYHTHSYESYFPLLGLQDVEDANKASDAKTNITLIGELLGKKLEEKGIQTIVDKTNMGQELADRNLKHTSAYRVSREFVTEAMNSDKKLTYFLDLHRDSLRKKDTTVTINNQRYAKIAFVIGEENKNYEKNAALALQLHNLIEDKYPGLSRGLLPQGGEGVNGVYNQDLSPNALLIEMGGVDNDMAELKNTVNVLAEVISENYWKAEKVNGEN